MTSKIIDSGKDSCKIIDVEYLGDKKLHLSFNDGIEGDIDLSFLTKTKPYSALKNKKTFIAFGLEHGTLVWANNLDISPELLYNKLCHTQ